RSTPSTTLKLKHLPVGV
ncbi:conserved repeat domain protein, partial [Vibrio parahaemolyticus V-223/04]